MKSISTIARVQKHPSWLIQDLFSIPAMTGFSKYLIWQPFQNIWDFVVVESCLTTKTWNTISKLPLCNLISCFLLGCIEQGFCKHPSWYHRTPLFTLKTSLHSTSQCIKFASTAQYTIHYTSLYTLHSTPLHSASSMHPLHIPESKQANKPLDCRQSSTAQEKL